MKKECDNIDCVSENPKNIQEIELTKDFNNEHCYWCEECRERDKDMIKTGDEEEIVKAKDKTIYCLIVFSVLSLGFLAYLFYLILKLQI